MTVDGWIIVGILAVMFITNFVICCSDLLPWNRRKKK